MAFTPSFWTTLAVLMTLSAITTGDESSLIEAIFQGYSGASRPVASPADTVNINVTVGLLAIQDLVWTDARLSWNPSDHDNVDTVIVHPDSIWKPDIVLANRADGGDAGSANSLVKIGSDGTIRWERPVQLRTSCALDLSNYPFDDQRCQFVFTSWVYTTNQMNMTSDGINLDSYEMNLQWEIKAVDHRRNEFFYECCPDSRYASLSFQFSLSRRSSTSHCLSIGLVVFISLAIPLLFALPCLDNSRYILGGFLLVTLVYLLQNLSEVLSDDGISTPALLTYYASVIVLDGLALMLSVLVTNVANRSKGDKASHTLLNQIFAILGKLVCLPENVGTEKAAPDVSGEEEDRLTKKKTKRGSEISSDWLYIARVLDRIFFVQLFILVIICAIATLPRH